MRWISATQYNPLTVSHIKNGRLLGKKEKKEIITET